MSDSRAGDLVLVERDEAIAYLRLNRPQALNAFDEALASALARSIREVADDRTVSAVILSGNGRSFMAGGDLTRFRADLDGAPETASRLIGGFHAIVESIRSMPKPVIAAVQGPVAGGGVGLALACDLVVAADDLTFRSAYAKLGTSPDDGTSWILTRLLGPRRATEFFLLGEPISAADALNLGLVNKVVAGADLMSSVTEIARRLARAAPGATAAVKRLVRSAATTSFEEQLALEKASFIAAAGTADFREGVTAFLERRPPSFRGPSIDSQ